MTGDRDAAEAETASIALGGTARYRIRAAVGRDSELGERIADHGVMESIAFTADEIETLLRAIHDAGLTHTNVLTARMRLREALRDLGASYPETHPANRRRHR